MKVKVIKPITLSVKEGSVVIIDASQLSTIRSYVEVIEEKEEKKRTKKGE